MLSAFALVLAASILVDGNGEILWLSTRTSTLLAITLFAACAVSAILVIVYDRSYRLAAVMIVLVLLFLLCASILMRLGGRRPFFCGLLDYCKS